MRFEFVEFSGTCDFLMGVYAYFSAPALRPYIPLDQYRGYLLYMSALTSSGEPVLLVVICRGTLPAGIVEFDPSTKQYTKVEAISRPDKVYFMVVQPSRSTIADQAIEAYEALKSRG